MKMKYAEIPGQEADVFAPVRRFTRRKLNASASLAGQELAVEHVRKITRRRSRGNGLTTFSIVMMLIVFAMLVTIYISNVVTVDALMLEAIKLDKQEQKLQQERENLRAEINMLTSYNRIRKIAVLELGLVHASQQPYSLTVYGLQSQTHTRQQ